MLDDKKLDEMLNDDKQLETLKECFEIIISNYDKYLDMCIGIHGSDHPIRVEKLKINQERDDYQIWCQKDVELFIEFLRKYR
jgi:hypothetical protein